MVWNPRWNAQFSKPLMRQILAIIKRDMQAALDYVTGAPGSLQSFIEYDLAAVVVTNFPALLLTQDRSQQDQESPDTRHSVVRLVAAAAVTHQQPSRAAENLHDTMLALDQVLTTAWEKTVDDFYSAALPLPSPLFPPGSMSPGLAPGILKEFFIEGEAYDEVRRLSSGGFARAATMSILCELEET